MKIMKIGRGKMKKSWEKPELVVLVRSRPEESVLAFCKTGGASGSPVSTHVGCMERVMEEACNKCSAAQSS